MENVDASESINFVIQKSNLMLTNGRALSLFEFQYLSQNFQKSTVSISPEFMSYETFTYLRVLTALGSYSRW